MPCDDCQADALAHRTFCGSCGHRLSAEDGEAAAVVADVPPADDEAADVIAALEPVRCESCGGPAEKGGLCDACERIFRNVLEAKTPRAAEEPNAAFADAVALAARPSRLSLSHNALTAPPAPSVASPALTVTAAARMSARATTTEQTHPMSQAPNVLAALQQLFARVPRQLDARTRSMAVAGAALAILASLGVLLGQQWLEGRQTDASATQVDRPPPIDREEPPARSEPQSPNVQTARAAASAESASIGSAPSTSRKSGPAPRTASSRAGRAKLTTREAAPVAVPLVATEAPALETLAPAALPIAPAPPTPEPVAAPVGPLFEMSQVNEPPRIASQVQPRLPDVLQGPLNDVVIVRVLVSQAGHPSTINLLRRSRAGAVLDDAVIAAVKQWTFSPARKHGQAVSCWFNVGVPLRRAE